MNGLQTKQALAPVEPTKEQLEIAELAKPLAQYLYKNDMCGEVVVSMTTVALRWEGFTAEYYDDFKSVGPPH